VTRSSAEEVLAVLGPSATCGHCRFTTALTGKFSVEDGRLVWRAAADPQPRRGPDLHGCFESSPVIHFEHVTVDGKRLSAEQVAALRQTAQRAETQVDLLVHRSRSRQRSSGGKHHPSHRYRGQGQGARTAAHWGISRTGLLS
jgi:hypothetical protein